VATKKAVAKKTAVPAKKNVAKSTPTKAPAAVKAPMPKMTKTQVIRQMAEQMDVSPKQIGAFFDLLIDIATTQTRKAGEFTIPGLGKLVKAQRAARMGRNPATGESIKIAVLFSWGRFVLAAVYRWHGDGPMQRRSANEHRGGREHTGCH
jgi:DNA-binding protein HU-beta